MKLRWAVLITFAFLVAVDGCARADDLLSDTASTQYFLIWTGDYSGSVYGKAGFRTTAALNAFLKRHFGTAAIPPGNAGADALKAEARTASSRSDFAIQSDASIGVTFGLPRSILHNAGPIRTSKLKGTSFVSIDRAVELDLLRVPDGSTTDLRDLYRSLFGRPGRTVTYSVLHDEWFAITGYDGSRKFYARFDSSTGSIKGFSFSYGDDRSADLDRIVIAMSSVFRPKPFANDPLIAFVSTWPEPASTTEAATLSTAAPPAIVPTANTGRRIALVIGNSAYANVPRLPHPAHDAESVGAALRSIGFSEVTVVGDADHDAMAKALQAFASASSDADWSVVYYAGHGIELGGTNYLIPTDARLVSDHDIQFEAIPLDQVLASVESARKLRLVLLDSCRENPFATNMKMSVASRAIGRGFNRVEPQTGTLVVYAARDGEVALDGDGANSPFTGAFLKELSTPGVEITKLFRLVRDDVMDETRGKQEPFVYGSLPGREDFYFVAGN